MLLTAIHVFTFLQACCKRRNLHQGLFLRRTALNDVAIEAHFDCTTANDTYEELFRHLHLPIMTAIQKQLEFDGYVYVSLLPIYQLQLSK